VAGAVGLQEGPEGVRRVLAAMHRPEPSPTRVVSRRAELPLPVSAAVVNELRRHGLVSDQRPSGLTPRGWALLGPAHADLAAGLDCPTCHGHTVVTPPSLAGMADRLRDAVAAIPAADLTLDQSHSTVETKVRRIVLMLRRGLLPCPRLLVLGDDDLMSVAVAVAGELLGRPLVEHLTVVEVSTPLVEFLRQWHGDQPFTVDVVPHDLRDPLPDEHRGRSAVAVTDPPYTPEGARLFLSRAAEGLRNGPGGAVGFSFGPKGPDEWLAVQRIVTDLGLAVQGMWRDLSEYHGAGVIGGRSHFLHLATTSMTAPGLDGRYTGPLYTADRRAAARRYRCLGCGAQPIVGPGAPWQTIGDLQQAGCPDCGGTRLRPLQLVRDRGDER
jgi:predicted methyltransferase/DNA-directed RNA polymerase subunit RPC12/RpoP